MSNTNRSPVFRPEDYCPICGTQYERQKHHCSVITLNAIDAANTRALNSEEDESAPVSFVERPLGERLSEGYRMIGNDEFVSDNF